jgi:hypothetical protein
MRSVSVYSESRELVVYAGRADCLGCVELLPTPVGGWCRDELLPRAEPAAGTADLDALLIVVAPMNWCDALSLRVESWMLID